ncbi:UNVERIFIED_CONTAM: General transcription factor 3C polypeptide 2 [Siphonaria sp. JEL0065]|nr:General transcription factor 3C polypeptide 2 [Siphonaria sp. JEL0065]
MSDAPPNPTEAVEPVVPKKRARSVPKESKELKPPKTPKTPKEPKEPKIPKEPKVKVPKEPKVKTPKEPKPPKDPKDPKEKKLKPNPTPRKPAAAVGARKKKTAEVSIVNPTEQQLQPATAQTAQTDSENILPQTQQQQDQEQQPDQQQPTQQKKTPKPRAKKSDSTPKREKEKTPKSSLANPANAASDRKAKNWHLDLFPSHVFVDELNVADDDADADMDVNDSPNFESVRPNVTDFVVVSRDDARPFLPCFPPGSQSSTRSIVNSSFADGGNDAGDGSDVVDGDQNNASGLRFDLEILESAALLRGVYDRDAFVLNVGGSVWGLDWAASDDPEHQYLAVGGYTTTTERNHLLGVKQVKQSASDDSLKGCVQIWRVDTTGAVKPTLDLCFLVECGVVFGLEWCAESCYLENVNAFEEKKKSNSIGEGDVARLGLLAVSFGDGSCRVINVPHPNSLKRELGQPLDKPVFAKYEHFLFTASLNDTLLWKPTWGGDLLATGCANGNIAIWDVKNVMQQRTQSSIDPTELEYSSDPILCFPAHNTAIFKIQWDENRDGVQAHQLLSCGYDGQMLLCDTRDPYNPSLLYKLRGIITAMCQAAHLNAFCVVDTDNIVRFFRPCGGEDEPAAKSEKMLPEGESQFKSIGVASHMSSVWDIAVSPYLPFVVSVGADGCAKVSNLNRTSTKSYKPIQINFYQLGYDAATRVFTYLEDTKEEPLTDIMKKGESPTLLFSPEIALQKITCNNNKSSLDWVASGGSAGLVRVESAFNNVVKNKKKK